MRTGRHRRDLSEERLELTSEAKEHLLRTLQSEGWQYAVAALRARAAQLRSDLCNTRLTLDEVRVLQGRHLEVERLLADPMRALSQFKEGTFSDG